jgi:5'-nucleotidase
MTKSKHASSSPLRILVSNDDGIDSPGLYALVQELKQIADITVVAPDKQQSAVGHAITVRLPLRAHKVKKDGEFFGYSVNGTPADCVKLGVRTLMQEKPDLVVSGINHGSNVAVNVIYSGTVSAATEGTILGIPSIAVSLATYADPDFSYAAKFMRRFIPFLVKRGLPARTLLNINVPPVAESEIEGIIVTKQGKSIWDDTFDVRKDPNGRTYYWLTGEFEVLDQDIDADFIAVRNKLVSITPIHYDLTDYEMFDRMKDWELDELR